MHCQENKCKTRFICISCRAGPSLIQLWVGFAWKANIRGDNLAMQARGMGGNEEVPLTVSVTSRSPAPTRGTTARQTYFPASSWRTDFRVSLFSLLRTCKRGRGFAFRGKKYKENKRRELQASGQPRENEANEPEVVCGVETQGKKMTKFLGGKYKSCGFQTQKWWEINMESRKLSLDSRGNPSCFWQAPTWKIAGAEGLG